MSLIDKGYLASYTLFFTFCGMSILDMRDNTELSNLGTTNTAPENLRRSAESLRLGLAVEIGSQTAGQVSSSESWADLEDKLSSYSQRLELLEDQKRKRDMLIMWLYLASAISMTFFTFFQCGKRHK
ncbi:hypothetical protein [Roseibacillus ishigakijimensis]|uniref:Uncharacterized protein n=1 Tax=Roseibacillus ishigakijimensis TaxID=454146 RepID=A0A934RMK0_9BACT|nr:hypothetical protein [Roseibacillus ishigakijimensis]MBK1833573.1 hypothetical protein [Roseibacillus ishigakijimensis]